MTEVRSRPKILVVDDDAALAEMLQLVLHQEGFDTVRCATGDAALQEFRASNPDLVLLDLMLPGRDGVSVCRDIRAESGVPIVMLTARSDTADVVSGLEAGADDYIAKPFKAKELVARIRDERLTLWESIDVENAAQAALCDTEDYREGFAAFQEKRKPEFRGR